MYAYVWLRPHTALQQHNLLTSQCANYTCRFLRWLSSQQQVEKGLLYGKHFSVFGVGSSSYPRFCAAANLMGSMLLAAGARPLAPVAKGMQCMLLLHYLTGLCVPLSVWWVACYLTPPCKVVTILAPTVVRKLL